MVYSNIYNATEDLSHILVFSLPPMKTEALGLFAVAV